MLRNQVSGLRGGSNNVESLILFIGLILIALIAIGASIYNLVQKARGKKTVPLNISVPKPVPKYRM
jgi:hypothetical protein